MSPQAPHAAPMSQAKRERDDDDGLNMPNKRQKLDVKNGTQEQLQGNRSPEYQEVVSEIKILEAAISGAKTQHDSTTNVLFRRKMQRRMEEAMADLQTKKTELASMLPRPPSQLSTPQPDPIDPEPMPSLPLPSNSSSTKSSHYLENESAEASGESIRSPRPPFQLPTPTHSTPQFESSPQPPYDIETKNGDTAEDVIMSDNELDELFEEKTAMVMEGSSDSSLDTGNPQGDSPLAAPELAQAPVDANGDVELDNELFGGHVSGEDEKEHGSKKAEHDLVEVEKKEVLSNSEIEDGSSRGHEADEHLEDADLDSLFGGGDFEVDETQQFFARPEVEDESSGGTGFGGDNKSQHPQEPSILPTESEAVNKDSQNSYFASTMTDEGEGNRANKGSRERLEEQGLEGSSKMVAYGEEPKKDCSDNYREHRMLSATRSSPSKRRMEDDPEEEPTWKKAKREQVAKSNVRTEERNAAKMKREQENKTAKKNKRQPQQTKLQQVPESIFTAKSSENGSSNELIIIPYEEPPKGIMGNPPYTSSRNAKDGSSTSSLKDGTSNMPIMVEDSDEVKEHGPDQNANAVHPPSEDEEGDALAKTIMEAIDDTGEEKEPSGQEKDELERVMTARQLKAQAARKAKADKVEELKDRETARTVDFLFKNHKATKLKHKLWNAIIEAEGEVKDKQVLKGKEKQKKMKNSDKPAKPPSPPKEEDPYADLPVPSGFELEQMRTWELFSKKPVLFKCAHACSGKSTCTHKCCLEGWTVEEKARAVLRAKKDKARRERKAAAAAAVAANS
ncbi:hypothetical protein P154DRAFT_599098 [Amniculicola lignicola CBS 123094]|uniref:Uncharacterized protein n=1 Tax=Amniculicola lignicola CBS 123094 TaxID=1392246 RepID=A0A6A5WHB6_9PLEO|nr:hypothetical protein P154DRAFT_599098 [Amniculicola lignicola CBS 123094]